MNAKVPSILIFTLDYLPSFGGVAMYLYGIARELPTGKISILADEMLIQEKKAPSVNHPIVYRKFFSKKGIPRWLPAFKALSHELTAFKADLIICPNILPLGIVTCIISRIRRKQYYISLHGLDILLAQKTPRKKWIAKFVLKHANAILVNSYYTKSLVKELLNGHHKPIVVIYPCPLKDPVIHNKFKVREELEFNSDQIIILSVGRLVRRKGFEKIISILPNLLKKEPDLKYVIIGNGPEQTRLQELIIRNKLDGVVELYTNVSNENLAKYYSAADIFAMPNSRLGADVEGFGLVFLEASLYGLPSIAGKSGGAPEAVKDGKTGILVSPESINSLESALSILIKSEDLRKELGEQGRTRAQEHFICRHEANKIFFCYNNV